MAAGKCKSIEIEKYIRVPSYYFQCVSFGVYRNFENVCMPSFSGAIRSTLVNFQEALEFDVGFALLEVLERM